MSPVPGRGQPSMWGASSGGSTPSFEPSPATLTWISTSGAGFCSSRRSADSEAIEWIRRTFGEMSFSLRLWRAPMKSHVNRSRCSSCLARRSWARFSPTSSMPASASAGRSAASTYLVAASTSTSGPIRSRTRSRLRRTGSASIQHGHSRLAPGEAVVATVREVEVGVAAGAAVEVLDLRDAGDSEPGVDHLAQVEHAAVRGATDVHELREHLGADLVAAPADAGADGGGRRALEALDPPLHHAARKGAPAAVEPGGPAAVGEGDGEAVGDEHQQGQPALGGEVAVDPRELLAARLGVDVLGIGPVPVAEVAAMDLPAHHDPLALHPRTVGEPPPVLGDVLGIVVGEDAQVERAIGAAGDAAVAGREDGAGARKRELVEELAHRTSLHASRSASKRSLIPPRSARAPTPSPAPHRARPPARRASAGASPRGRGRSRAPPARPRPAGRPRRSRAPRRSGSSSISAPAPPAPPAPGPAPAPRGARCPTAPAARMACAPDPAAPRTTEAPRPPRAPPRPGRAPLAAAPPPTGPAPAGPPPPSPPARRSRA